VHSEGSKQCIVPGYAKSKLTNCYSIDACLTTNANRTMQTELKQFTPGALQSLLSYDVAWHASVRERSQTTRRLRALQMITEDHLDASIRNPDATMQKPLTHEKPAAVLSSSRSLPVAVESLERR
jgi:DNA-binding NtrC family response regulator